MRNAEIERRLRHELHAVVMRLGHAGSVSAGEVASGRGMTLADLVEDAQIVQARESDQLGHERLARRAKTLIAALERFQAGSYGTCDECGEPISAARLRALPSAARCVTCQEQVEHPRGRGGRDR
jgi:DnaK suppressor protein